MQQNAQITAPRAAAFLRSLAALALGAWFASGVATAADPADLCAAAARTAAAETGVPYAVLLAVSLTETGRSRGGALRPWPWTVNMEGEGRWFDTPEAALDFARAGLSRGARSFDLGCFQLNYRWHGDRFPSLEAMMEPAANARYAAGFLADLHAELGDWSLAAGAYHSRTEVHATRYRARFDEILAGLDAGDMTPPPVAPAPAAAPARANPFPLLRGGAGALGSLVPLNAGG